MTGSLETEEEDFIQRKIGNKIISPKKRGTVLVHLVRRIYTLLVSSDDMATLRSISLFFYTNLVGQTKEC